MFISYPDIVILAGGLGTRLRGVIDDVPKSMAPVNGRPFLEILLNYIDRLGFKKVILSTGYMSDKIRNHFRHHYKSVTIEYAIENEPLGTGGAIKNAATKIDSPYFIVMNGDTFFPINLQLFFQNQVEKLSDLTIALRNVENASRYGQIVCDDNNIITNFKEKSEVEGPGLINGGIYIIKTKYFQSFSLPDIFSFEKDFLQRYVDHGAFRGEIYKDYFLDIGIPEDYEKAQKELNEYID